MPGCQVRAVPIEQACPFEPWLSFGLMGGGMQPQGHVQIMLNLIDFDMGLQEAGDAARWEHRGGCEPTDDLTGDDCESDIGTVHLESGIPPKKAARSWNAAATRSSAAAQMAAAIRLSCGISRPEPGSQQPKCARMAVRTDIDIR